MNQRALTGDETALCHENGLTTPTRSTSPTPSEWQYGSFTLLESQINEPFLRRGIRSLTCIREGYSIRELKLQLRRRHHAFLYISMLSLHDYVVKLTDLTFHVGHDHKTSFFFVFGT